MYTKRLETLAAKLYRFRLVIWILVAIATGLLAFSLFASTNAAHHSLLYLCGLLWSLSLVLLIQGFSSPLPPHDEDTGFIEGLRLRFQHFSRWVLSVVFLTTCVFLMVLTFRAFGVSP